MLNHEFIWMLVIVIASVSVQHRHHQVDGLVWSLVLGNPVVDMSAAGEGEALSASSSSSSETSEDYDYDDQQQQQGGGGDDSAVLMPQHPRNTRPKLPPGSRPTRHHLSHDKCLEDRQCGKGRFCDLHYGICRSEKSPGFACRRDRMCARGLACMFGRCQAKIPTGEEGSRCHGNSDCQAGLCCARRHGEAVCQRKLTLGQRCFVPDGGLEYSLNQLCPCDVGLVCQQQRNSTTNGGGVVVLDHTVDDNNNNNNTATDGNSFPFWTSTDNMRCQFHEMALNNRRT